MSIRLMTLVWDIQFPTQSQKLLLLKMADYASDAGGSVFPSTETLADKIGCDERTVQRAIKAFRGCGILHLVRAGGGKPGSTNEWMLNVKLLGWLSVGQVKLVGHGGELELEGNIPSDTPVNLSFGTPGNTPGNLSGPPANEAGGVTPVSPTPGTTATQSVNNHQIEPSGAGARASDGARATPARKWLTAITLPIGDMGWDQWMAWLSDRDRRDIVAAAQEAQRMVVASRYPREDSPLPRVDGRSFVEKRKMGEAA